ncbi:MAG: TraB/GumN family protein, partial [Deltaproteobacteria bacterium]|nr:TraB/GumN family protein [Deltaproteobacteria bacterium]
MIPPIVRMFLAALSIALLPTFPASAQPSPGLTTEPSAATTTPQVEKFTHGLLWKIEAPGASASADATPDYLFGTMHSDDPRITTVPEEVQHALAASDSFCMEMVPDATAMMAMSKSMVLTDGKTLQSIIGKPLFEQLTPLMTKRGIPTETVALFKPWAVFLT